MYFTKGYFESDPVEFRSLFVDARQLQKMEDEQNSRWVRSKWVIFWCIVAMSYLSWTCSDLLFEVIRSLLGEESTASSLN